MSILDDVKSLPKTPGVYQYYDVNGKLLYIGKAVNLKNRVSSYFQKAHDRKTSALVAQIHSFKVIQTDTNIEALILESNLVNQHKPPFNIKLKDDKTFLGVYITEEEFPRVFPARITEALPKGEWYGPYTSAFQLRSALKIVRRIFPWCDDPANTQKRPCFYYHLKLCSGACVGEIDSKEYKLTIKHLKLFLLGKKKNVILSVKKSMDQASKNRDFEQAGRLKKQLIALEHIQESALVAKGDEPLTSDDATVKIECFDIANIGDSSIVGGMVVFVNGSPSKNDYRQFKIKTLKRQNDVKAIAEMVKRRLNHPEWTFPDLLLIDGGLGQVNAVKEILYKQQIQIPVVGIAKGPKRNKTELIGDVSFITLKGISLTTLVKARDEAHRFARRYFFVLRKKELFSH